MTHKQHINAWRKKPRSALFFALKYGVFRDDCGEIVNIVPENQQPGDCGSYCQLPFVVLPNQRRRHITDLLTRDHTPFYRLLP